MSEEGKFKLFVNILVGTCGEAARGKHTKIRMTNYAKITTINLEIDKIYIG